MVSSRKGKTFSAGRRSRCVAFDLDLDGLPDLASVGETGDVTIQIALPTGGHAPPERYPAGAWLTRIAAGSLDSDGLPDLVILDPYLGHARSSSGQGQESSSAAIGWRSDSLRSAKFGRLITMGAPIFAF